MLQFFIEKDATVSALKIYADNLRSSESKLIGNVNVLKSKTNQKGNQSKGQSDKKCELCLRMGHLQETCRVSKCDYCKSLLLY